MTPLACASAEERLLAALPSEVNALAVSDPALAAHLSSCASCAALASDLASLEALRPSGAGGPSPELVTRTLLAAAPVLSELRQARRRQVRAVAARVVLALGVALPLLGFVHLFLLGVAGPALAALVSPQVFTAIEAVYALLTLGGLSLSAFLLTLIAGAAARAPAEVTS